MTLMRLKVFASSLLIGVLLFQAACGQTAVTETLQLVVTAAGAAIDILDPSLAPIVAPYLSAVSSAVDYAITELDSSDPPAQKAAKIAQQFAAIAAPILPPGTASTIVSAIEAVASAVNVFLGSIGSTSKTAVALHTSDSKALSLSRADRDMLPKIRAANAANRAKLARKLAK
jgi:hypothetical protein